VGYVVPGEGESLAVDSLRAHLRDSLPEYMVPAAFVVLEGLPLTPNGKVDRKALPLPDESAYAYQDYEAPEGETEQALATIWQELLPVERVGRYDNFFEIGGHSLLAVQLISRIRQSLNVEIGLRAVFEHSSLQALAVAIQRSPGKPLPPIERAEAGVNVPLSYAQQRLWFLSQLPGVSEAYHISGGIRLLGDLDRAALKASLNRIVWRHEALRTRFELREETVWQIVEVAQSGFALLQQSWICNITGHQH